MPSSSVFDHLAEKFDDLYEAIFAAQEGLEEGSFFDATQPRVDQGRNARTASLRGLEAGACGE